MHQFLAGKPGISVEVTDNARHLFDRSGAGIDVGTAPSSWGLAVAGEIP